MIVLICILKNSDIDYSFIGFIGRLLLEKIVCFKSLKIYK